MSTTTSRSWSATGSTSQLPSGAATAEPPRQYSGTPACSSSVRTLLVVAFGSSQTGRAWAAAIRTVSSLQAGRAARLLLRLAWSAEDKDDAGMHVTVRRATAADAPALARLRWRWPGEERDETGPDHAALLAYFSAWVVDHLSPHLPFLAELAGRVARMAWLMLATRVPSPTRIDRRTGDVQSVYVVPELRNSGVGEIGRAHV